MKLHALLYAHPLTGIVTAVSGGGLGILALLQIVSAVIGLAAAVFGAMAGYYTWRIQRAKARQMGL